MTIRRVALFIFLVALSAGAAFGQISPPILPNGAGCTAPNQTTSCVLAGTAYSVQLSASIPNSGQIWTLTGNPTVPAGLSIGTATGLLTGPVTSGGTFTFVVSATYAGNPNPPITISYTMFVSGAVPTLTMANPTAVSAVVGNTVTVHFTGSGGVTPYTYSLQSGAVPGLALNASTGVLSGTATTAGTYSPVVQVTDSTSPTAQTATATGSVTINNAALTMANPAAVTGTVGNAVSMQFTATGGVTPYTYTLQSGTIPPGLNLNASTGLITGTATTAGTYTPTILVTDSASPTHATATATGSITINNAPLTMANPTPITATINQAAPPMQFTAMGGVPPYVYTLQSGTIPPGLNLNASTGLITGTATTAGGPSTFTILVTDSASPTHGTATATGTITVSTGQTTLTLATPAAVTKTVGDTASMQFAASGGVPPYTYALQSGAIPPGLTLNASTGLISGTTTTAGTYLPTIMVTDSATPTHATTSATGVFTINSAVPPLTMGNPTSVTGTVGTTVSTQFTATGGVGPYVYTLQSGSFPPGLNLNAATGVVTGTATTAGAYIATVLVTDSATPTHATATATGAITINAAISTLALPGPGSVSGAAGQTVSLQFTASGGVPPYTYTLQSGSVPGMNFNTSTGLLTGIPTSPGTYTPTVLVTDSANPTHGTATTSGTITVSQASSLNLTNSGPVTGAVGSGQSVTVQFTASGGVAPYTYSLQSGAVPGLSFNTQTGTLTGFPIQAGSYSPQVQVTDSTSPTHQLAQSTATVTITGLTMPNPTAVTGAVGQTVSMQFTASGGTPSTSTCPSYTYAFVAGSLPPGLSLNAQTGLVTGQATQANTFTFEISATDCSVPVQTATAIGSITISATAITGVTITPSGTVNAATQPPVTLTIGTAPATAITGTLSVGFARTFDGGGSREILFTNGAPTVAFTIAAGSTQAIFPAGTALIVGTAQGFGNLSATFRDALGNNITPSSLQPTIFSINGTAPVITSFKISLPVNNVYTATVVGYSSTLDMANGVFTFTPTSGTNLADPSVTVSLATPFTAWYSGSQSNQYGGQFRLTIPFTFSVTGGANSNPIVAATVTLTNAKGSTTSPSAVPQ